MPVETVTRALAAVAAASVLSSCGAALPEPAPRAAGGGPAVVSAGDRSGRAAHHQQQHGTPPHRRGAPGATTGGGSPAPNPPMAHSTRTPGTAPAPVAVPVSGPDAHSCVTDPAGDPDASGSAPSYADLVRGCLDERGRDLVLTATGAGPAPATAGPGVDASFGFALTGGSGPTLHVYAELGSDGWSAYATRGHGRRPLAAPVVAGDRVSIALPVAELGSARRFGWLLESSWLESTALTTSYAFDSAPDRSTASFERR